MEISYASSKLREVCESRSVATKKHGGACAARLGQRIADLAAAPVLDEFRNLPGRCHELHGSRRGQLALDLPGGKRLVIQPANTPAPIRPDGSLDWTRVTAIRVVAVEDYH